MERTGRSINSQARSFSHFNSSMTLENRRTGPSKFQESLAERSFLRRLYTGQRIVEDCPIQNTRTTFLIVFSPDGTKFATTNGNRNVYIISVTTKAILKTLSGHKRTPWTLAFHPSNNNVLASGCLDGEVRVWNLEDNSCEVWQSPGRTVIASLAFHPRVKVLVIATHKDLYFLDWSRLIMMSHATTENIEEKIRYVKFDSSGDKLITAIALKSKILSLSDAISFREAYLYTRGKETLFDFQRIYEFLRIQIPNCRNFETVDILVGNSSKPTWCDVAIPYLCAVHYHSFQDSLNVDLFCPTEFSRKVIKTLESNTIVIRDLSEKCCMCKYTWLYEAVFKCRLLYDKENQKHAWNFTASRQQTLLAENEDETNGFTENVFRYCFEQYARIIIAPYFAHRIPGSVSRKCLDVDELPAYYSNHREPCSKEALNHYVSFRSACFLNHYEKYNTGPEGSFTPFLKTFAELYQFLASLQRVSSKSDERKLNTIMTECEYLCCKMVLIYRVIEGDNKLLFSKRPHCVQTREDSSNCQKDEQRSSSSVSNGTVSSRGYRIQHLISGGENVTEARFESSWETKFECNLCKPLETGDVSSTSNSMKMLRRELDVMTATISHQFNAQKQRCRIEKLYGNQFDHNFDRKGSARIQTIHTVKKCILMFLSMSITKLKELLKASFEASSFFDRRFRECFIRMMVFIARKMISFCNVVLDFVFNFDYSMSELMKERDMKPLRIDANIFLTNNRTNEAIESLDRENDPIFDEEHMTVASDLSDDELSSNANFGFSPLDDFAEEFPLTEMIAEVRKKGGVVCSSVYLTKHLKLLEMWDIGSVQFRDRHPKFHDLLTWTNLNVLNEYFYQNTLVVDADHEGSLRALRYHPLHRLQMWNFSKLEVPNIASRLENIVVTECKVHNDSTIAISHDDSRVAVLLSTNQYCQPDWLGIFSLERKTLGHILYAVSLSHTAVSLSFSPTNEYLAVGYNYSYVDGIKMADVVGVGEVMSTWRKLNPCVKSFPVVTSIIGKPTHMYDRTTVNCIKWIPGPGRGLVLGTSAGEIKFFS